MGEVKTLEPKLDATFVCGAGHAGCEAALAAARMGASTLLLTGNIRVCLPTNNPIQNARDVNIAAGGRLTVRNALAVTVACTRPTNV